jgi:hypothetical protein
MPMDNAVPATRTVAEFVRKGMAQQAVDESLAPMQPEKALKNWLQFSPWLPRRDSTGVIGSASTAAGALLELSLDRGLTRLTQ